MIDPAGDTVAHGSGEPVDANSGLAPGAQLGKYRLERIVGTGGMGVVWAARDPDLERDVAIKVLRGNADADLRLRLLREARAMAKVRHPNVLTIYEASSDAGRDYIAMELVEGGDLERWLGSRPPRAEIWDALLAAGRGLAAAHAAGLVHRDFKPHNVLRECDGRVVVTDFGLARALDDAGVAATPAPPPAAAAEISLDDTLEALASTGPATGTRLTRAGALIGTPAYMAPEQLDGGAADARADQFAFCVTAWQALAGARPFCGGSIDELRRAVREAPTPAAGLPRDIRAVLERGLAPDPTRRWPDLAELLAALSRTAAPAPWKRFALLVAASSVVSAALVLVALSRLRPRALVPAACRSPETAFGAAWPPSPEVARQLHGEASARLATALGEFRTTWLAAYKAACAAPTARVDAVLACLDGERDEVEPVTRLLAAHPDAAGRIALERVVPDVDACTRAVPASVPAIPAAQRDAVLAARALLLDATTAPPGRSIDAELAQLHAATSAWGAWDPLTAEIDEGLGVIALARGQLADARAHFQAARTLAEQCGHARLAALAQLDRVGMEMQVATDPTIDALPGMIDTARAAVDRAGDDAELALQLDVLDAELRSDRGEITRIAGPFASAMLRMNGHPHPALFRHLWGAMMARTSADLPPSAMRSIQQTGQQYPETHHVVMSDDERANMAWISGDLDAVHRALDRAAGPGPAPGGVTVTGRVLRSDGTPAAGARVVAWSGELVGDGRRVYTDPRTLVGDVATCDAAGRFTVRAPPNAAVIAELGDLRSEPRLLGAGGDVALAATRTVAGACGPRISTRLDAFVRFAIGDASWEVRAPVAWHERFAIGRVPPGGVLGAIGPVGPRATRRVLAVDGRLAWPRTELAVDVIEHGSGAPGPHDAWLFRGTLVARTRAQVEAAARTRDSAYASLGPIGDVTTEEGRRAYRRGDLHAVFRSTPTEPATACVVDGPAPDAPARCVPAQPVASEASYAVTIEPTAPAPAR